MLGIGAAFIGAAMAKDDGPTEPTSTTELPTIEVRDVPCLPSDPSKTENCYAADIPEGLTQDEQAEVIRRAWCETEPADHAAYCDPIVDEQDLEVPPAGTPSPSHD